MWAPSRTSDLSELIFLAAANFTLTHQKRRSYQPCLQPPFPVFAFLSGFSRTLVTIFTQVHILVVSN